MEKLHAKGELRCLRNFARLAGKSGGTERAEAPTDGTLGAAGAKPALSGNREIRR
jgi:hypothetical protein